MASPRKCISPRRTRSGAVRELPNPCSALRRRPKWYLISWGAGFHPASLLAAQGPFNGSSAPEISDDLFRKVSEKYFTQTLYEPRGIFLKSLPLVESG